MRLKTLLSRSLLVAVGLCVGASAWADDTKTAGKVTTNADIDFSNAITNGVVKGTVDSMVLSNTTGSQPFELGYTSGGTTTSGDVLRVGNGTGTVIIPDDQLAGKRDSIVISFDMYFGKLSGKSAGFYLYDNSETPVAIGGFYHNWYNGTNTTNTFNLDVKQITSVGSRSASNASIVAASNKTTFEIHLNYATGTMYVVQSTNGKVKQTTSAVSMGSTNPLKTFVVQSNYNNSDRRCWFDNLVIKTTTGDYTVASANYTVNWVLDGTTLKSETRSGDVGAAISLLENDKGSFFGTDEVKYFYSSDDAEGKIVAEDGSTVITITCRKAETWTYSVVSSTGATLNTGSAYEGETVTYYWPEFVLDGTTLYQKSANKTNPYFGATGTLDSNNKQFTVTYNSATINGVVFYKEAEDMEGFTAKTTNNATIRCSNGTGGICTTDTTLTTLPAGSYKIFGQVWGTTGLTATIKAGGNTVWELATPGYLKDSTSDIFTLTEATKLTIVTTGGNDQHMLDLVTSKRLLTRP